jgi:hypothetical protein
MSRKTGIIIAVGVAGALAGTAWWLLKRAIAATTSFPDFGMHV